VPENQGGSEVPRETEPVSVTAQLEPRPLGGPEYPVDVMFPRDKGQSRLWGIPFVGMLIRWFLVIPQLVVMIVLAVVMAVVLLINWLPVLVNGRQAGFAYSVIGGYLRLWTRVAGYVLLLTGRYPPFGPGGEHPIEVTFDETDRQHRLWGIPLVGLWIRWILLVPHWIVLTVLGFVIGILILVSWVPVLLRGRQAEAIIRWVGGYYRWAVRVAAYGFLLTGTYPPFRLAD
jgi:uncharacterized protein DUF4389